MNHLQICMFDGDFYLQQVRILHKKYIVQLFRNFADLFNIASVKCTTNVARLGANGIGVGVDCQAGPCMGWCMGWCMGVWNGGVLGGYKPPPHTPMHPCTNPCTDPCNARLARQPQPQSHPHPT